MSQQRAGEADPSPGLVSFHWNLWNRFQQHHWEQEPGRLIPNLQLVLSSRQLPRNPLLPWWNFSSFWVFMEIRGPPLPWAVLSPSRVCPAPGSSIPALIPFPGCPWGV